MSPDYFAITVRAQLESSLTRNISAKAARDVSCGFLVIAGILAAIWGGFTVFHGSAIGAGIFGALACGSFGVAIFFAINATCLRCSSPFEADAALVALKTIAAAEYEREHPLT